MENKLLHVTLDSPLTKYAYHFHNGRKIDPQHEAKQILDRILDVFGVIRLVALDDAILIVETYPCFNQFEIGSYIYKCLKDYDRERKC